jgi:hypothetical protein
MRDRETGCCEEGGCLKGGWGEWSGTQQGARPFFGGGRRLKTKERSDST